MYNVDLDLSWKDALRLTLLCALLAILIVVLAVYVFPQETNEGGKCNNLPPNKGKPGYCDCVRTPETRCMEDTKCRHWCHRDQCECFHPSCNS